MTGVPIDEGALKGAREAVSAEYSDEAYGRQLVAAYLGAVGARVEYQGEAWDDGDDEADVTEPTERLEQAQGDLASLHGDGRPPYDNARMFRRVIFPWKPLTDTEEERPTTTPIEVCRGCGWNMATLDGYCPDCVAPDTEEETDGR